MPHVEVNCAVSAPGHGGAGAAESRLKAAPGPDLGLGRNGEGRLPGYRGVECGAAQLEGLNGLGQESPTPRLPTILLGTGLRSR